KPARRLSERNATGRSRIAPSRRWRSCRGPNRIGLSVGEGPPRRLSARAVASWRKPRYLSFPCTVDQPAGRAVTELSFGKVVRAGLLGGAPPYGRSQTGP